MSLSGTKEALMVLNAIPGLSNRDIREGIRCFSSAEEILARCVKPFSAESQGLREIAEKISQFDREEFLKNEYRLLCEHGVCVIEENDALYPASLKMIPDAPVLLYYRGEFSTYDENALAIVGSRLASIYGRQIAEKFAGHLASLGITIVSGMARGVDTAAHWGCLKSGGNTIAVLGCGLSQIYPPENKDLYEAIGRQGAVISEFPMSAPPKAMHFPRRNRIISGLSLGVLIVEAAQRSGALITGRFALEQGREVFAVPGKVDQMTAQGTNRLIQEGAKLVTCVEDILEELLPSLRRSLTPQRSSVVENIETPGTGGRRDIAPPSPEAAALSPQEEEVYRQVSADVPVALDRLTGHFQQPVAVILARLMQLELKRCIKQLPGKFFIRVSS
jgi:DNA processing protein